MRDQTSRRYSPNVWYQFDESPLFSLFIYIFIHETLNLQEAKADLSRVSQYVVTFEILEICQMLQFSLYRVTLARSFACFCPLLIITTVLSFSLALTSIE